MKSTSLSNEKYTNIIVTGPNTVMFYKKSLQSAQKEVCRRSVIEDL
jgi:hypothetical protein